MKHMLRTAVVVKFSTLLLAIAAPTAAFAATEATIDCWRQSNACFADVYSDSGPVGFLYEFHYYGVDAVFPADCTNQNYCRFYCRYSPGPIRARLIVIDANYNIVTTTDWVPGLCTQQDIELPPIPPA